MFALELFFSALLGLCLGSFATALVHRVPLGLPWAYCPPDKGQQAKPVRSACPQCNHRLSVLDLIPVFSWLFLRGHCRYCRVAIPPFYFITELLSMAMVVLIYLKFGMQPEALFLVMAVPFLAALLMIDLKHMILPNQLVGIVLICGALQHAYSFWAQQDMSAMALLLEYGTGAVIYGTVVALLAAVMGRVLRKPALGGGDVKFFVVVGLWLGVSTLPAYLMLSGVMGIILGAAWRVRFGAAAFPFGPALIVSFFVLRLYGAEISYFLPFL